MDFLKSLLGFCQKSFDGNMTTKEKKKAKWTFKIIMQNIFLLAEKMSFWARGEL